MFLPFLKYGFDREYFSYIDLSSKVDKLSIL